MPDAEYEIFPCPECGDTEAVAATEFRNVVARVAELEASLAFAWRPLGHNSHNGYVYCQNCGSGWFPADGEPETHDPRCAHVLCRSSHEGISDADA